jgi:hypothetical protein
LSLSGGIDDPDIADHPRALQYFALLRGSQADLVVSQKHMHAFLNRVRRRTIDQLARVDARERIAHRLIPQVGSKNTFRHSVPFNADCVSHVTKLGAIRSAHHC